MPLYPFTCVLISSLALGGRHNWLQRGVGTGYSDKNDYFGFFNIDNISTYFFFGEINNLEVNDAYAGNYHLHGFTKDNIYTMEVYMKYNPDGILTK